MILKRWENIEITVMLFLLQNGFSITTIARYLDRSTDAVRMKKRKINDKINDKRIDDEIVRNTSDISEQFRNITIGYTYDPRIGYISNGRPVKVQEMLKIAGVI